VSVNVEGVWNEEDKTFWCTMFDDDDRYYLVLDDSLDGRVRNVCFRQHVVGNVIPLALHYELPKNWETVR
jgi:hypothetical protein